MNNKMVFLGVALALVVAGTMIYQGDEVDEDSSSLETRSVPSSSSSQGSSSSPSSSSGPSTAAGQSGDVVSGSAFVRLKGYDAVEWDKKMSTDYSISRARIGSLGESDTLAVEEIHRGLTLWLMVRLELLSEEKDRDRIQIAVQEIADRYYLLDRVVKIHKMKEPGASSILKEEEGKLKELSEKMWKNPEMWMTVDNTFQKNGMLRDEHVVYMLRKWMMESRR